VPDAESSAGRRKELLGFSPAWSVLSWMATDTTLRGMTLKDPSRGWSAEQVGVRKPAKSIPDAQALTPCAVLRRELVPKGKEVSQDRPALMAKSSDLVS